MRPVKPYILASPLKWVSLITLATVGALLLICTILAVGIRQDISHPESIVPWAMFQVATDNPLYTDWRLWPHRLMPYGPLLCWPIGVFAGEMGADQYSFAFYVIGRLQSLLYLLGIWASLVVIWYRSGMTKSTATVYSLAYVALGGGIIIPLISCRADLPAMFWVLCAALVGFGYTAVSFTKKCQGLVALLFLISIAYKPSFWAFPMAYTLYIWQLGGFRRAVVWAFGMAGLIILYIAGMQLATGSMFWLNQVGASSMGLSTEFYRIAWHMLTTSQEYPYLTWDFLMRTMVSAAIAIWIVKGRKSDRIAGFALYYLLALPVNLLMLFKVGAGLNYVLESFVLQGILLGYAGIFAYKHFSRLHVSQKTLLIVTTAALILYPAIRVTIANARSIPRSLALWQATPEQARILELPSTALLGDQVFTHPVPGAHALSDPVPFAFLTRKGTMPKEPLATRIQGRVFTHFVMSPGMKYLFFSPDRAPWVGQLLTKYYKPDIVCPAYEIWKPLPAEDANTSNSRSGLPE